MIIGIRKAIRRLLGQTEKTIGIVYDNHVYWPVPKAGSSTVRSAILKKQGNEEADPWDNHLFKRIDVKEAALYKKYNNYTVVRHPIERLKSCYRDKIVKDHDRDDYINGIPASFSRLGFSKRMSFDEFANHVCDVPKHKADFHFLPQVNILSFLCRLIPSKWFKIEEDIPWLEIGLEEPNRKINVSNKKSFKLSNKVRKKLYDYYKEDFRKFGY